MQLKLTFWHIIHSIVCVSSFQKWVNEKRFNTNEMGGRVIGSYESRWNGTITICQDVHAWMTKTCWPCLACSWPSNKMELPIKPNMFQHWIGYGPHTRYCQWFCCPAVEVIPSSNQHISIYPILTNKQTHLPFQLTRLNLKIKHQSL